MRDVISQITKLLALAESPAEEEARSAAMQAVRLIKKHKVELRMPGVSVPTGAPPFEHNPFDAYGGSVSDYVTAWMGRNMRSSAPPAHHDDHPPRPRATRTEPHTWPPQHAQPTQDPPPPPKKKHPTVKPVRMVAQFNGKCPHCKLWFHIGDEILWMKRRGATHAKCETYWEEK